MGTYVDPEIDPDLVPIPTITADILPEVRRGGLRAVPELSGTVEQTVHLIDDETGVAATVHRPAGLEDPAPALYWIHGGGYVTGSVDNSSMRC